MRGTLGLKRSADLVVRIWDASHQVAEFRGHSENVYAPAFRPDGRELVTAGDPAVGGRADLPARPAADHQR